MNSERFDPAPPPSHENSKREREREKEEYRKKYMSELEARREEKGQGLRYDMEQRDEDTTAAHLIIA